MTDRYGPAAGNTLNMDPDVLWNAIQGDFAERMQATVDRLGAKHAGVQPRIPHAERLALSGAISATRRK